MKMQINFYENKYGKVEWLFIHLEINVCVFMVSIFPKSKMTFQ